MGQRNRNADIGVYIFQLYKNPAIFSPDFSHLLDIVQAQHLSSASFSLSNIILRILQTCSRSICRQHKKSNTSIEFDKAKRHIILKRLIIIIKWKPILKKMWSIDICCGNIKIRLHSRQPSQNYVLRIFAFFCSLARLLNSFGKISQKSRYFYIMPTEIYYILQLQLTFYLQKILINQEMIIHMKILLSLVLNFLLLHIMLPEAMLSETEKTQQWRGGEHITYYTHISVCYSFHSFRYCQSIDRYQEMYLLSLFILHMPLVWC